MSADMNGSTEGGCVAPLCHHCVSIISLLCHHCVNIAPYHCVAVETIGSRVFEQLRHCTLVGDIVSLLALCRMVPRMVRPQHLDSTGVQLVHKVWRS